MTLRAVLDDLNRAAVILEAEGGQLRLRALFDDRPLTADTRDLCRVHKRVLLDYARFIREADALLLDSTRRIGAAWAPGCDLDTPEWDNHEKALHEAYWAGSLERLQTALQDREDYARTVFAAHRNEVHSE
jgi:hypothetical protein